MSRKPPILPTGCSWERLPDPRTGARLAALLVLAGLVGCVSAPRTAPRARVPVPAIEAAPSAAGGRIAALASAQLGQPYRYGGDGPEGFDCSGLVLYVHRQAGINVPRTTMLQRQRTAALDRSELRAGDIVFFTLGPRLVVDHVGIYLGDGRFIHAPHAGATVRVARLDDGVFRRGFAGGARFWSD